MDPARSNARKSGFTFVELMLALALGALVAAILALLIRGLLSAGEGQSARLHGPFAARAAVRTLSREVACAFAPPVEKLAPLTLSVSTEPGKPEVSLSFYAPVPAEPRAIGGYDIERVTYEVGPERGGRRGIQRISVPCSGPGTNAPITNLLFEGRFVLAIEALTNGTARTDWPPPGTEEKPLLPTSLRLSLAVPGEDPLQTEVLIQAATGIRCPIERKTAAPEPAEAPEPAAN